MRLFCAVIVAFVVSAASSTRAEEPGADGATAAPLQKTAAAESVPTDHNASQILLSFNIVEVNVSRLQDMGFKDAEDVLSLLKGIANQRKPHPALRPEGFEVFDRTEPLHGFVANLIENNLARTIAEPTIICTSGRLGEFHSGGRLNVPDLVINGKPASQMFEVGTHIEVKPELIDGENISLDLKLRVGEVEPGRTLTIQRQRFPVVRSWRIATGIRMRLDQTLAFSSPAHEATETVKHADGKSREVVTRTRQIVLVKAAQAAH